MDDSHPDLSRLADDAMQREYPERFSSREEWDAYNEECDRRDRERAYLKGSDRDLGDLNDLPF
jgi:hypothetical protein